MHRARALGLVELHENSAAFPCPSPFPPNCEVAIDEAPAGASIKLRPGLYEGPMFLREDVALFGDCEAFFQVLARRSIEQHYQPRSIRTSLLAAISTNIFFKHCERFARRPWQANFFFIGADAANTAACLTVRGPALLDGIGIFGLVRAI